MKISTAPPQRREWGRIGKVHTRARLYVAEFDGVQVTPTIEVAMFEDGPCSASSDPLNLLDPVGLGIAFPTDPNVYGSPDLAAVAALLWNHSAMNLAATRKGQPLAFNLFSRDREAGAAGLLGVFDVESLAIGNRQIDRFAIRALEYTNVKK